MVMVVLVVLVLVVELGLTRSDRVISHLQRIKRLTLTPSMRACVCVHACVCIDLCMYMCAFLIIFPLPLAVAHPARSGHLAPKTDSEVNPNNCSRCSSSTRSIIVVVVVVVVVVVDVVVDVVVVLVVVVVGLGVNPVRADRLAPKTE